MSGENTISTMDGLFHEVWDQGAGLDDVVPASSVLYDIIDFDNENLLGDSYHQGVVLTNENGFTYNGSGGTVVSLATPIPATMKDASTSGFEMIGRARLGYTAASRAANEGPQAFKKAWGTVLLNLRKASMKRLELTILNGQRGLGIVDQNNAGVLTITDASWSPTTWAGLEGAVLEAFDSVNATANQHNGDLTITAVSFANKTVTVSGTNAAVVQNDILWFKGARTTTGFNEPAGLMKMAGNAGSLHGIDASQYALWAGNVKGSFGIPTMGRFLSAITEAVDRGLEEKVYIGVNPKTWEVLNADLAAQRMYDGSYSRQRAENGSQAISYYGQVGEAEIRSMPYMRRGEACIFPESDLKRVGSADVGMGVPGAGDGRDIFFHLPDHNAVEARTFSDQAPFCLAPAHLVQISGITYAS